MVRLGKVATHLQSVGCCQRRVAHELGVERWRQALLAVDNDAESFHKCGGVYTEGGVYTVGAYYLQILHVILHESPLLLAERLKKKRQQPVPEQLHTETGQSCAHRFTTFSIP